MADLRGTDNLNDYMTNSPANGEQYATFDDFIKAVDLSVWEMGTACGSCHIGGGLVEHDRQGTRLSMRPPNQPLNAYDWYPFEMYNSATGLPQHYDSDMGANMPIDSNGDPASIVSGFGAAQAMWSMPATTDFKPLAEDGSNAVIPAAMMPEGWEVDPWIKAGNPYINLGMAVEGQAVMPNVREMDCLYCHMDGYNNIINSVAVQMGYFVAAPSLGSGLMNMFTFAYDPNKIEQVVTPMGTMAYLSGDTLNNIKAEPPADNCRQCHIPTTMANFSDMFDKFLAAAPMSYNPASPNASAINGMQMPSYDLNAPWLSPGTDSPLVYLNPMTETWWFYGDNSPANGPFGIFPMALNMNLNIMGEAMSGTAVGGGNPGGMGPLLYDGMDAQGNMDQNALKKATIPFPRADFFKRGDNWDGVQDDVHFGLGCAGCHFDTNSLAAGDLNQCDPGRGFSTMGGIENGSGPAGIDTRSTVKRCRDCHVTGTNYEGKPIETFGATDPTAAHIAAGLMEDRVQAVRLDGSGNEEQFLGTHLDAIACQTCHVDKAHMAVRSLDSTSGNRYPSIIGIQSEYGMMSMFTDPAPDHSMQFQPVEWQPLYGWDEREQRTLYNSTTPNPEWRREIIPINMIVAAMWDDSGNPAVDQNGDGAEDWNSNNPGNEIDIQWDPPIMRDMKAGMNFAPGPFATIPVGFGGDQYQSAYDAQFNFTGAFDYVGIYGGNIMLTNANEIKAYKQYREGIKDAVNGKSWSGTKLTYFGGNPFQIEHGVTKAYEALGAVNGCKDCHAPGTGFFSGDYDMTGTAIPASATFYNPILDTDQTNMMQRPAVDIEITGLASDLRTGSEAMAKYVANDPGKHIFDVKFEEYGDWDAETEVFTPNPAYDSTTAPALRTTDLKREEYLYPHDEHGADFATVYGTDLYGKSYASAAQRVAYLESIGDLVTPQANVLSVGGSTGDLEAGTYATAVEVTQGVSVALVAEQPASLETPTYSWYASDGGAPIAVGASTSRVFNKTGTYQLTLTVTAGSHFDKDTIYVKVVAPAPPEPLQWQAVADGNPFSGELLVEGDLLPTHTKIVVYWYDYTRSTTSTPDANGDHAVAHTFRQVSQRYNAGTGTYDYPVLVRVYNGSSYVKYFRKVISINP